MTKAKQITDLLSKGMLPADISKKLRVSRAYVYGIKSKLKKRAAKDAVVIEKSRVQRIIEWFKNL